MAIGENLEVCVAKLCSSLVQIACFLIIVQFVCVSVWIFPVIEFLVERHVAPRQCFAPETSDLFKQ